MKLRSILEATLVDFSREDVDDTAQTPDDDSGEFDGIDDLDDSDEELTDEQPEDGEQPPTDEEGEEDPDRQGDIRVVKGAHLVYKRKSDNNLYDELWIYKQNQMDTWTLKTYDAIIAGSDIPKGETQSADGTQHVDRYEVGNPKNTLVFVEIRGLSN